MTTQNDRVGDSPAGEHDRRRWPTSWRRLAQRPSRPMVAARMQGPWLSLRPYALHLLRYDHRRIIRLATQLERLDQGRERAVLLQTLTDEVALNSRIEHELFFAAIRGASTTAVQRKHLAASVEGRRMLEQALADLADCPTGSAQFAGRCRTLRIVAREVLHDEEHQLFHHARRVLGRTGLVALGRSMQDRRRTLLEHPDAEPLVAPTLGARRRA